MGRDIKSMTLEELTEAVAGMGEQPFRARQLYRWMHARQAESFQEMTDLPGDFRSRLQEFFSLTVLRPVRVQTSKADGTKKFLFELPDKALVESVFLPYRHGNAVCVSSQVGCRMGCAFCASAIGGLERNLTAAEMLEQVYRIMRLTGERVSNVVVMGSGEPLDNLDNLLTFLKILTDEAGLHIGQRSVTVSTCGLPDKIRLLARQNLKITLALSLHATTDEERRRLMPVARKYTIHELLDACAEYSSRTGRRVTLEYTLVAGVNDSPRDSARLTLLAGKLGCHVNLILANPVLGRNFRAPAWGDAAAFKNKLEKGGINVTMRREMGRDIDGACGQLRRRYLGLGQERRNAGG